MNSDATGLAANNANSRLISTSPAYATVVPRVLSLPNGVGGTELSFLEALCFLPREVHAVNYGQIAQNSKHPKHRSHTVEKSADDQQDDSFGTFHETDL